MVWKQTRVPSLSKMTHLGLKKEVFRLASFAEGDAAAVELSFAEALSQRARWRLRSPFNAVERAAEKDFSLWYYR